MLLVKNIKRLLQVETDDITAPRCGAQMRMLPCIENAFLLANKEKIVGYGPMSSLEDFADTLLPNTKVIDATGKMVLPSFCDCHTHLVYAGSREREYVDKINGLSYKEVAARGGGILNSAKLLHTLSEEELFEQTMPRAMEIIGFGTGAVEIKSGYGLSVEDELKILRVIRRISNETPLTVRATFLGAHDFPQEYRQNHEGYISLIINEMIPRVAEEGLATYIDAFCEEGFYSVDETERIFEAGKRYGLIPKVHANQMSYSGGIQVGVKCGAISVDHLEASGEAEIASLLSAKGKTMPVLLPGATFFMNMEYAPARRMIDAGLPMAIASNYNPGSCPAGDMKFMIALSCMKTKLSPEEAINGATINGAFAMGVEDECGSISIGKKANFFITKEIPSYEYLTYAFASPLVDTVVLNGKIIDIKY